MDIDDEGIFLAGIKIARIQEPALHFVAVVFPGDAFCFAPRRLEARVAGGHRSGRRRFAGDQHDFRCVAVRPEDARDGLAVFCGRKQETKMPAELSAPSPDQRCSILPVAGSSVAMALLPPTNSLKSIFPFGCQPSHAAEAFISFVRFFASPASLLMVKMSPPVSPSSLMMPSMKAIRLPSGDQTGLAICSFGL